MTLAEAIKGFEGSIVRLGAKQGFIYVDTSDKMTPKIIEQLSKQQHEQLKTSLKEYTRKLERMMNYPESKLKRKELKRLERNKRYVKSRIEKLTKELDTFTPFLERNVIRMYESKLNNDMIIIFEGNEAGDYWTCEEYREGRAKEDE